MTAGRGGDVDGALDDALRAIGDPTRRRILELVTAQERTAGDIASHFDMSRPAVSQHLSVLREAGLLEERREGTRRWYRARLEPLRAARLFIDQLWSHHLDRLRAAVEHDHPKGASHDR